jgi:tetratricopeptide (TPR) repeat protein
MLLALIAVGWIAYSLRPRPSLATELAYRAAAEGRLREGKVGVQAGGVPAVTEAAARPAPAPAREERTEVPSPVASLPGAAVVSLSLRLARSLDNPPAYAEDGTSAAKPGARSGVPPAALEAQLRSELARAGRGESGEAQLNQLLGAVLQRLSRHEEAVSAYRAALEAAPQKGSSWIGMGMSLEALGRKQEALDAYRRGVGSGSLDNEQQVFAQQRILVLR